MEIMTVQEIAKMFESALYKIDSHTFLSDVFELGAISIANSFDTSKIAEEREQRFSQIMSKYNAEMQQLISDVFAEIYVLLINQKINRFGDYLGELYMISDTGNKKAGQFFTPYHVSKISAFTVLENPEIKRKIRCEERIKLYEPTCGSGGMVIAAADILTNKYKFDVTQNLFVHCADIDQRCIHMAYLQIGLAGIPAVIYRKDALSGETLEVWETPAAIMRKPGFWKEWVTWMKN